MGLVLFVSVVGEGLAVFVVSVGLGDFLVGLLGLFFESSGVMVI